MAVMRDAALSPFRPVCVMYAGFLSRAPHPFLVSCTKVMFMGATHARAPSPVCLYCVHGLNSVVGGEGAWRVAPLV